jgi:hypothetical protein
MTHRGDELRQAATDWIMSQYDQSTGGFRFSPVSPVSLLGSSCAALAAEILGALVHWPAQQVEAVVAHIRRHQKADGWFEDPYLQAPHGSNLDQGYLHAHVTFLATMALDALGRRPGIPLHFLHTWQDDDRLYEWIDRLDWTNPWRESNWVEWIGYWLLADQDIRRDRLPLAEDRFPPGFKGLMRWLREHQDPETGYWGSPPFPPRTRLLHQMAAAYHHYVFFYATGQPIRFLERIVDNTLALQQEDGLFTPDRAGGGPCEDLDAVDILANMRRLTSYRRAEIESALQRALEALLANQKSNGAFLFRSGATYGTHVWDSVASLVHVSRRPAVRGRLHALRHLFHTPTQHYGGCPGMPFSLCQGDMFSQWFRPLAIALVAVTLGYERSPVWWDFGFRRQITQGWWPGL